MKCPRCNFDNSGQEERGECKHCGIVFKKYLKARQQRPSETHSPELNSNQSAHETPGRGDLDDDTLFFRTPSEVNIFYLAGRAIVLMLIFLWGIKLVFSSVESNYSGESFMHLINLPFHEAGHIIFGFFGRFITVLGGSLMQLIIPLICLFAFLFQTKDPFAAAVSLWWAGENFIDLAPYINDARDLKLMLLGGVTGKEVDDYHDWEFILGNTGLINYDHILARAAHLAGASLMIIACAWGGLLLYKQFRRRERL